MFSTLPYTCIDIHVKLYRFYVNLWRVFNFDLKKGYPDESSVHKIKI